MTMQLEMNLQDDAALGSQAEAIHTPAIRFKGFSGDWEVKELGSIADLLTGNPFNSKNFKKTGFFLVRGMNVKRGYLDMSEDISEYWPTTYELEKFLLQKNDIVIQMDGALIGKSYAKIKAKNLPALLVQRVTRVRGKETNSEFIYQYIQRDFLKHISKIKTETAVPHLSLNDIRKLQILIPETRYEETKIGQLFQQLDHLITQHQHKHTKLLNLKQALLQKMFPKQGATVPEVRFKGFSGDWEVKELGSDVADIIGGGTPSTQIPEYWNGDIDWYSPTEIGWKVYADESEKKITKQGLENSSARILPANKTILFTSRAGIGDMAILRKDGCTNQGFQSFVLKNNYDTYFLYSSGHLIKSHALKNASGSTFLEISGKQLGKMPIKMPLFDEQAKIGQLFQQLDHLINQQHALLTKLSNLKQAYLAKMFINSP